MNKAEYAFEVVVTAERGNYLKFTRDDLNEDVVGKPVRIIFSKQGVIPELIEKPIITEVNTKEVKDVVLEEVQDTEEKLVKKKTRKKSSK